MFGLPAAPARGSVATSTLCGTAVDDLMFQPELAVPVAVRTAARPVGAALAV